MHENRCPVCGIDKNEWCECKPIICPHCGQIVRWFGERGDSYPCKHVVAWGTLGNEFIVWENEKYELKFQEYYSKHSYNKKENSQEKGNYLFCSEEFAIDSFAEEEGLICECYEPNCYEYWNGSYVLFTG